MERVVAPSPDPGADARTRGQGRAAQTKDEEGATQMVRATTVPWASAPGLRQWVKRGSQGWMELLFASVILTDSIFQPDVWLCVHMARYSSIPLVKHTPYLCLA